ncbi:MAG: Fe-S cluster assembly protein SufD [Bdellovibrionales bacterium]|nr:Fe-S cluster assembly protein SufD [Bdellovibrionales bacterium]
MNWISANTIEERVKDLAKTDPKGFNELRTNYLSDVKSTEWPTHKAELFRNLDLGTLYKNTFRFGGTSPSDISIETYLPEEFKSYPRLVFVDGLPSQTLSTLAPTDSSVVIEPLSYSSKDELKSILKQASSSDDNYPNAFLKLNSACFDTGAHIKIKKKQSIGPLVVLFIATPHAKNHLISYKNILTIEPHAKAEIIEIYSGSPANAYLTTAFSHIHIQENAHLHHIKLQLESNDAFHIGGTLVFQDENSSLKSFALNTGCQISRTDVLTTLQASGSHCLLNGLYYGNHSQTIDQYTSIDHAKPHASSTELYKGILSDESHGGFTGKIIVRPHAQKSDSKQMCRNLLLSKGARADAIPQLEIYADDVKCSHGATIGELDEEEIFYLRSRGLDSESARHMLISAFANETLEPFDSNPLKRFVNRLLEQKVMDHG